jgi:hypothetical protein
MPSLAIGLSKSILSVNPSFLDMNIDLIDEALHRNALLFTAFCREKGFTEAAGCF